MERQMIRDPSDIIAAVQRWKKREQENFLAITLDGCHAIIKVNHVTKGLVNRTLAHPRECFRPAIKDNATSVVFVHNHPSGSIKPSREDNDLTERLCMSGQLLGINVLDHIIITPNDRYFSYREDGKIQEDFPQEKIKQFIDGIAAEGRGHE